MKTLVDVQYGNPQVCYVLRTDRNRKKKIVHKNITM